MKPTFQNSRPGRSGKSQRPAGHQIKSPATDWSFQTSTVELHGGAVSAPRTATRPSAKQSFYAFSQGFAAATKWEDRIEGIVLSVVIGMASLPILHAIYIATRTV